MIYTLTLNPSIDYVISLDSLKEGFVNRTSYENFYGGGKGINVSRILKEFDIASTCLGFTGGFTGEFIKNFLHINCISHDFIDVQNGCSRINVKIKTNSNETEINGRGPEISKNKIDLLMKKLQKLNEDDILILSGSIHPSLPENFYENIMKIFKHKKIKIIVDTTGNLLLNVLKFNPFLIKPNQHEIEEIFNVELFSIEEIIKYGFKLKNLGAKNVLISLGKNGAILITENNEIYKSNVPNGIVKNSVGAGDSMVGGFIAGYLKNLNYEEALKFGAASGSATAFSLDIGEKFLISKLLDKIEVMKITGV